MYIVRFSSIGVNPVEYKFKTKKEAIECIKEDVNYLIPYYWRRGYRKNGSIKKGFIYFWHPVRGTDASFTLVKE